MQLSTQTSSKKGCKITVKTQRSITKCLITKVLFFDKYNVISASFLLSKRPIVPMNNDYIFLKL